MRRRIRRGGNRAISSTSVRPTQLDFSSTFQWAAVLIFATSLLFGIVSVGLIQRGYTQTPAISYALLICGSMATIMQMVNLWRGRLIKTCFQFLRMLVTPRKPAQNVTDGDKHDEAAEALLKEITCSCKKKGQAVGVCHHCGRFICKWCGYFIPDKRFTLPNKSIRNREQAWHCQKCLRQYHENNWRYVRMENALRQLFSSD